MKTSIRLFLLSLCILGVIFSLTLEIRAVGFNLAEGFCSINAKFDCNKVTKSSWGYIFNFRLSTIALAFYLFLTLSSLLTFTKRMLIKKIWQDLFSLLAIISFCFSCYYFFISSFIIKAMCPFCIVLYLISILILITLLFSQGFKQTLLSSVLAIKLLPTLLSKQFGFSTVSLGLSLLASFMIALTLPEYLAKKLELRSFNSSDFAKGSLELKLIESGNEKDYFLGNKNAKIELVEFADIQCPYCQQMYFEVKDLLKKYGDQVFFVFKNYPLDQSCNKNMPGEFHKYACKAGEYARCAGEQGLFWETLEGFLNYGISNRENEESVLPNLEHLATKIGVDQTKLKECIESGRQLTKIKSDVEIGSSLKLESTPSFWLNGKLVENPTKEKIEELIKALG